MDKIQTLEKDVYELYLELVKRLLQYILGEGN